MIVLIPAKGHSERIWRKNFQPLKDNISLLAWTIMNWKRMFPHAVIYVASDDVEAKQIAKDNGAFYYFDNPYKIATGRGGTGLFVEFCDWSVVRPVVCAQCTSPFTFKCDVELALRKPGMIVRSGYVSTFHTRENQDLNSQDIAPTTVVTGNFLIARHDVSQVKDWCEPQMISPVNPIAAIDINEPADLEIARWVANCITIEDLQ